VISSVSGNSESLIECPGLFNVRVAINLLTDNPHEPTGAVQFWTHLIPEMNARLHHGEELLPMVSPANRHFYQGYGAQTRFITFPWSNE
jgi:hypothetical protein